MKLAIGSAFRNSAGRLANYERQVRDLQRLLPDIELVSVHGDSTDGTEDALRAMAVRLGLVPNVIERSHGGPVFGSTEQPERFKALSYVGNGILENIHEDIDYLFYVESDLLWDAKTVLRLLARAQEVDIVSPLIYAGAVFYDVWGFRGLDGQRFSPFHPYHSSLKFGGELTEVSSVGSALLMRGQVARECRIINDGCLVGFCEDARNKGYRIWCDSSLLVNHPA